MVFPPGWGEVKMRVWEVQAGSLGFKKVVRKRGQAVLR